ncbi:hypothetical protein J3Q64DRAFT_1721782 [Phycomyces blakesleeanus]|uniref:Uncharacterized protein n=1 Tax=Phycomyces blakesleeanus TaxID=4837 RepID=A0ABR3B9X1_PHYBL
MQCQPLFISRMGKTMFRMSKEKRSDPMEDVLTQITDPNVAFETVTNRNIYLSNLKHTYASTAVYN